MPPRLRQNYAFINSLSLVVLMRAYEPASQHAMSTATPTLLGHPQSETLSGATTTMSFGRVLHAKQTHDAQRLLRVLLHARLTPEAISRSRPLSRWTSTIEARCPGWTSKSITRLSI